MHLVLHVNLWYLIALLAIAFVCDVIWFLLLVAGASAEKDPKKRKRTEDQVNKLGFWKTYRNIVYRAFLLTFIILLVYGIFNR